MYRVFLKVLKSLGWLVLIFLVIRSCFLDIFNVPSGSMENTLRTGDLILVNKSVYSGTLAFLFSKLQSKAYPQANDILVFRTSDTGSTYYVKRCICPAGNVIEMRKGSVFVNHQPVSEPDSSLHYYKIWYNDFTGLADRIDHSEIDPVKGGFQRFKNYFVANLTKSQLHQLTAVKAVDSIAILGSVNSWQEGSREPLFNENIVQDFAPLMVPAVNTRIRLNAQNYALYKGVLENFEKAGIHRRNDKYYIGDRQSDYYTFKHDYYFMMGDNRENSFDSRSFGLIPKKCIEGKVIAKIR